MAFQAVERGSTPCGVTAGAVEQYHARLIIRRRRANRTPAIIPVSYNGSTHGC